MIDVVDGPQGLRDVIFGDARRSVSIVEENVSENAPSELRVVTDRQPRQGLAHYVDGLPEPKRYLGLTHVTTGRWIGKIIAEGFLSSSSNCPYLNEPLLYAFYGRAAYRRTCDGKVDISAYNFPVVFVLDPHNLPDPKYVFGFDSGAFVTRRLDEFIEDQMQLLDFSLTANVASAGRLVEEFYGNADQFLQNTVRHDIEVPQNVIEALSYHRLIRSAGAGEHDLDDRTSTPELIFSESIDVAKSVMAVILPAPLAGNPAIGLALEKLGIAVEPYEWTGPSRPSEYHMLLRAIVSDIYRRMGLLK